MDKRGKREKGNEAKLTNWRAKRMNELEGIVFHSGFICVFRLDLCFPVRFVFSGKNCVSFRFHLRFPVRFVFSD
jgi:hypothetical protein